MIKILLINGNPLIRQVLKMQIELESDMQVVSEIDRPCEAALNFARTQPDIILIDLDIPGCSYTKILNDLRMEVPHTPLVVLTLESDHSVSILARHLGAMYLVIKQGSPVSLVDAIHQAVRITLV